MARRKLKMHVVAYYIVTDPNRGMVIHGTLQRPNQPMRPWEATPSNSSPKGLAVLGDFTPAERFQIRDMAHWALHMARYGNGTKRGAVYFVN